MYIYIKTANSWLNEHIEGFVRKYASEAVFVDRLADIPIGAEKVFQFCDGWGLDQHFHVHNTAVKKLISAYPNSDALARKDCLARVVDYWVAKRPESVLATHVPRTVRLSLDYSEYVEEALTAADDLSLLYSLEENSGKEASQREWWILKPAMLDCADGIRIFSTIDELASNLELAEAIEDDDEYDDDSSISPSECGEEKAFDLRLRGGHISRTDRLRSSGSRFLDALVAASVKRPWESKQPQPEKPNQALEPEELDRIPSSQMRDFVAQRYVVSIPPIEKRKWHVRAYVLAVGRLKVYVFREMLLLLALDDYKPPWQNPNQNASLSNTALQSEEEYVGKESMRDFWTCQDDVLPGDWKKNTFDQICQISAELFHAASHTMADKFIVLDTCFELFALDFLLDSSGTAWLLEANSAPAFYSHGAAGVIARELMESITWTALEHMGEATGSQHESAVAKERMIQVLDDGEGLGKSNIREIIPENSMS